MANETLTENLVYDHFTKDPLYSDKIIKVALERQQSVNSKVDALLQGQSKGGGKGSGRPDFILTFPTNSRYIIVVECKAELSQHESKNRNEPADYAVDGVLHYARALSTSFDVVAIAVSGETKANLAVSHFFWKEGADAYEETKDRELLSLSSYLCLFKNEHFSESLLHINIVGKAIYLNELFHAYRIQENERCTMVSAVLLALTDDAFRTSYRVQTTMEGLVDALFSAIRQVVVSTIRNQAAVMNEYNKLKATTIFTHDSLTPTKGEQSRSTLEIFKTEIISYLYENVYPLLAKEEKGFDVLGLFYTEFIRYAGTQQSLGLVLTPRHITELFCDLCELSKDDVLYDPCCGTAGFLIAGMKRMTQLAGNNSEKKQEIKDRQLVGIEQSPQMYTYAYSNMMLRGDGKSNIYNADCFQSENIVDAHRPTAAFLNPPYNDNVEQMRFVEHALAAVAPQNGRVVAIVQMSCGIKSEKKLTAVKKRILQSHRLRAVLSMPDDLFYPVGVVTCIMVFDAGRPNKGRETWFGYFKDDKFEKRKNQGRVDARALYEGEKKRWLDAYYNHRIIPGLSVTKEVGAEDEWCAEAYMETDYSTLTEADFERKLKEYIAYTFLNGRKP